MIFRGDENTENFPLMRMTSETKRWEVGLVPMLFGVRVRAGLVGSWYCSIDYCAGDRVIDQYRLLATIIDILSCHDESVDPVLIEKALPSFKTKPIFNDETCWKELQRLQKNGNGFEIKEIA